MVYISYESMNIRKLMEMHPYQISSIREREREGQVLTLYNTAQTKMFRGMRKKFIIVLRASSGIYWDLIFMIEGQNIPTQASNAQNPTS